MDLVRLQQEIYNLLYPICGDNLYLDYLPIRDMENKELDYFNNIYSTYSIGNITNNYYKQNIVLEIQVVSNLNKKHDVTELALNQIDKILDKAYIETTLSRINKSNIWYMPLEDIEDNKEIVTLNYYIENYQ